MKSYKIIKKTLISITFPTINIVANIVFFSILLNIENILESNAISQNNLSSLLNLSIIILLISQILSILLNSILYSKNYEHINKNLFVIFTRTQRSTYVLLVLLAPFIINLLNTNSLFKILRLGFIAIMLRILSKEILLKTRGFIKKEKKEFSKNNFDFESIETKMIKV